MKNKLRSWILITLSIFWGISLAYSPYTINRNCNEIENQKDKAVCENEKSFDKFTETTGTREMSTTCCSYLEHNPEFNLRREQVTKFWWLDKWEKEASDEMKNKGDQERKIISGDIQKLSNTFLKLSSQIYGNSPNKPLTLKHLSSLFNACRKGHDDAKVRAVCEYFAYDLIGISPKMSSISLWEVKATLKKGKKLIKRTVQFSDLNENYTPINYHYASIHQMYHIGEYAFGLMEGYDYFDKDKDSEFFKLLILKAGDTHRQDFADIQVKSDSLYEVRLIFEKQKLSLFFPIRQNKQKETERLTPQFQFQQDWSRKLVGCFQEKFNAVLATSDQLISKKKLPLKNCENLPIRIATILWK